ncbi:hypothetical protein PCANC_03456 [Puccinia coronata f. sp. avenae]|uniref:Uncharacterized protein n=1 Tax=Puccinia coronata f. sp. avenae TaxID=200324 RepID=A0A2N5W2F2_9BASI|nr:hypothetical protein PCANC_03456 [Puccinia coronata f. sp. avenae]
MKQKHLDPEKEPSSPAATPSEVIDVDQSDEEEKGQSTGPKHSWVWNFLKESNEPGIVACQVVMKTGKICGSRLKKDKSSSTKSFHGHLQSIHHLSDPSLAKKTKMHHMDLEKWSKSGTLQPKVQLNNKTLKSAMVYMIADCDLSFAIVEQKSF